MNDAPVCWGKFHIGCICEYSAACQYYTESENMEIRPLGGQDYNSVEDWAPDLADYNHIPGNSEEEQEGEIAYDLAGFLNYILHLDDYTLGILAEIIAPTQHGKRYTVADLARIHGISRQGMHRKMVDIARKSPELSSLLAITLRKIRYARQKFTSPCVRKKSPSTVEQMKFQF